MMNCRFCKLAAYDDWDICDWCRSNKYIMVDSNDCMMIYGITYGLDAPEIVCDTFKREDAHKAIYDNIIESDPIHQSSDPIHQSSDPIHQSSDPIHQSSDPIHQSSDPERAGFEYKRFMAIDKIYQVEKAKTNSHVARMQYVITELRSLTTKYIDPPNILDSKHSIESIRRMCIDDNLDVSDVLYYLVNEYERVIKEHEKKETFRKYIDNQLNNYSFDLEYYYDYDTRVWLYDSVLNLVSENINMDDQELKKCVEDTIRSHILKKRKERMDHDYRDEMIRMTKYENKQKWMK